jgi:hypothetical protein
MKSFQLTKNSTFFITIFCLIASQVFAQDNLNSQKPIHVTDASWSSLKDAIQEAKILPEDVVGVGGQQMQFGQSISIDGNRAAIAAPAMFAHGVVYIFDFDGLNWNRTARIIADDIEIRDKFGNAVSLQGDRLLIGNYFDNDNGSFAGAAYIFELENGEWIQKNRFTAGDISSSYGFGISLSLDGDRALIGSRGAKNGNGESVGAAYVFELVAGNWVETHKLIASDGDIGDEFGASVNLENNRAIVGSRNDDDVETDSGAAYIFDFTAGMWVQTIKLTSMDSKIRSNFGLRLKLDGDRAVVSATSSNELPGVFSVSTYVYDLIGGVWSFSAKLEKKSSTVSSGGGSVEISGDTIIVGSLSNIYVFKKAAGVWSESTSFTSLDVESTDAFGITMGFSGANIIVGAYLHDGNGYNSGSAYVFTESMGVFNQTEKFIGETGGQYNGFGNSVNISGNRAVVGVQSEDDYGRNSGAAYIFELKAGTWVQLARLTASDGVLNHFYGGDVDIDGDRVVISAVNDSQVASTAGAVYIYDRDSSGNWNETKIVASDGTSVDRFGTALSLDGDRLIIGSEDDENGIRSGSAYVFENIAGVWTEVVKLLPSDIVADDYFGRSVSLEGDVAIVGAERQLVNGDAAGVVYVFEYSSNAWSQTHKLSATNSYNNLAFGLDVDLQGSRMLIGSNGGGFIFDYAMGSWSQTQRLSGAAFVVSLDGDIAVTAHPFVTDGSVRTGISYVHELSSGTWYRTAIIRGDGVENGFFGRSIALKGDVVFIGAPYDDVLGYQSGSVYVFDIDVMPDAVANNLKISEDANATTIDVLANDINVDGGPKVIQSVIQPANGVVVNNTTSLSYQPDLNYCNTPSSLDTFSYTLNGGSTTTVSVRVGCVDDLPVAVVNTSTLDEDDAATTIDVLANDTDVDAGPKSIDSVIQPANGTVVNNVSDLTYTPNENYCNDGSTTDDFTYRLNGGSQATVLVSVNCVDDFPIAVANTSTILEDVVTTIDVLTNDTDIDAGPKLIELVIQPTNGTVINNGSNLTYTPNENYCNDGATKDDFIYKLNGGSEAIVSVEVICVDDHPVAVANIFTVIEDDSTMTIDVLSDDTDVDAGPMIINSVTQPSNGVVVNNSSDLTYTPNENYCNDATSADVFSYRLNGGSEATVSVDVNCINDAPSFDSICDIDVSDYIGISNQLFQMQIQDIIMGPNEGSTQQVMEFNTSIDDPDGIFNDFTVDASGLIMMDMSLNLGIATIGVTLIDNGGISLGGQDTSVEQFFDVVYLDSGLISGLIYRDSFDRDCNFVP